MSLKEANAKRWQNMHIPMARSLSFENVANKIKANKARYQAVANKTGVPWEVIGVIHYRESSLNFNTYLGNGEPLNRVTRLVPKGRGPFSSWEEGAIDALVQAPPYAAKNKDWSIGGTLEIIEKYNGLGYASKGIPSPYVWAGTDQYSRGKYVADGVFDPNYADTQLGCAGLLKFLAYKKPAFVPQVVEKNAATLLGSMAAGIAAAAVYAKDFVVDHWIGLLIGAVIVCITADIVIGSLKRKKDNVDVQ